MSHYGGLDMQIGIYLHLKVYVPKKIWHPKFPELIQKKSEHAKSFLYSITIFASNIYSSI